MALNANPVPPDDELLPCGRSLESLWASAEASADGPDAAHVDRCPHCAAALGELRTLDELVRQARAAEQAPADTSRLTQRVMDVVRLELRPGRTLPLGAEDEDLWIVEAAAAKSFRSAADAVPGVRAGSCRIQPLTPGARTRGPVDVRIEVAAALGWNLQEVARTVREAVRAAADEAIGLDVRGVDVRVIDVLDDIGDDTEGSRAGDRQAPDGGGEA